MLERYYKLNGWDKKTGRQTQQGLIDLDLKDIAYKLRKAGELK